MPFALLLAACAPQPYGFGDDDTSSATSSFPVDTGSPVRRPDPTPSQWGTCATLRSMLVVGGPGDQSIGGVASTPDGGRYLTAASSTVLTLGEGQPSEVALAPLGEDVHAVARYDAAGVLLWAVPVDGDQGWLAPLVARSNGGVVAGGACDGTTVLAAGAVPSGCPNLGESDAWLVAFDPDGTVAWTRWFGGAHDDAVRDLAPTADGGFVVSGVAVGDVTFGAGEANETSLTVPPSGGYLARYTSEGAFLWAVVYGGSAVAPNGVTVDADDEITLGGTLLGNGINVFGDGTTATGVDAAGDEAFVARYAGDGTFRWVTTVGGADPEGREVAPASGGGVFAVGWFDGVLTFGRGEAKETSFVSDAWADAWVARFGADGAFAWAATSLAEEESGGSAWAVASNDRDEALVAGSFNDLLVLGHDTEAPVVLQTAPSGEDVFVALYGADGGLSCAVQSTALPSPTGAFSGAAALGWTARSDGGWDLAGNLRGAVRFASGTEGEVEVVADAYDAYVATIDFAAQSVER
jgi:hypothetical protein